MSLKKTQYDYSGIQKILIIVVILTDLKQEEFSLI